MKNILVVVPDDRLGGAEQYLKNISYYHLEAKNKVYVVFLKRQMSGQWMDLKDLGDVKFYYSNSATELSGIGSTILNVLKIKSITFDYIYTSHLHTTSFVGFLIRFGLVKKKYFIGRESTTIFHRFKGKQLFIFKMLYRLGYPSLDLLINQTQVMRDQLIEGLPWIERKTKLVVIPNPINLRAIQNIPVPKHLVHPREFIVSAGRLIPEKGYDILIDSFKEISKEYPELDLVILGEGHKRPELEEQIRSLGLQNKVILKGHVDNVYAYFKQAKLCVVSSRVEGFPNVLLQMMSQNNRVVSTKCAGGIDELSGIICVKTDDEEAIRLGVKNVLENDLNKNQIVFSQQLEERSLESFQSKLQEFLICE
ncbi:glycosyltransferase [Salegentibacter chungangensis]|uniref:Glycosyltransferase n=1 Tax=Salegentibacter chungangensis TaxID=1335724 RepID=A0ABW3NLX4_9FLAO